MLRSIKNWKNYTILELQLRHDVPTKSRDLWTLLYLRFSQVYAYSSGQIRLDSIDDFK